MPGRHQKRWSRVLVNQEFAKESGTDGYVSDTVSAAKLAKRLVANLKNVHQKD